MRNSIRKFLLLMLLPISSLAIADEPQWYVVVYGENHLVTLGASANANVIDGEFLADDFSGAEYFVHTHEDYSLAQYRKEENTATGGSVSVAAAVGASTPDEAEPTSEFGPLADSGLAVFQNGDFKGWYCDQLYVTPVGTDTFKLRCDEDMTLQ